MKKTNKTIDELIKEEKNRYFRQWRSENKEKVKRINAKYWKNRTEKRLITGESNVSGN